MAVSFHSENVDFPPIKKRATANWIKTVAENHGRRVGEISYLFCDDAKILEINRQYLQHDFYTDIITFDYSENNVISGDISISLDTVRSNSQKYQTEFTDELNRVIIHGILHLCGLDDHSNSEQEAMRIAENTALLILRNTFQ
ncbi:MAG: rRNA maturation RNase YbeY [Bacteroidetes bacterium GWD2_45_23]|nr:MAG: rRNA maturation RNase YbeY [Bacteroidetes bacterium GWC2_46_850]OFX73740.1 MAG: rRNA maturation RNase YbeY [Bacteroidetes bacterium GWC1_47_7]OFX87679.1 MAG: rRNA maturation RNase YbeY [Bacteroidetes bacterium GWD2_45_23]HAR38497.1 rRNA maturation RNase YbeY [Porphyromonadaceae bacterium]HBB01349.1 rRNA maturation RNase YbeY [Porphyromonadaceae bacterium]